LERNAATPELAAKIAEVIEVADRDPARSHQGHTSGGAQEEFAA
jgi:hypothetical protein